MKNIETSVGVIPMQEQKAGREEEEVKVETREADERDTEANEKNIFVITNMIKIK